MTTKMRIHIKRPGQLHKDLGVAPGKKIPLAKIEVAKNSTNPAVRKRANFAFNARHWNHG